MSTTTEPSDLPNGRSSPEPEAVSSHSDHNVNLATGAGIPESADEESAKPPTFPEQTQISNLADRDLELQPDKALDSLPNGNGTGPDHKPESCDVRSNEGRIESSELADAKINGVEGAEIEPVDVNSRPELRKGDEGNRTFTMGELLNELKDDGVRGESADLSESRSSPYAHENVRQEHRDQNNVAMELINSVTGVDDDGRSRQRILTFAASRYASAIERNPEDYDALYNWALVLQESADNVNPESSSPSKDALLEEACKKYEEATRLCPTLHDAYYNWAIAISDRAKLRGRTNEAEELLKQATRNYERAVQLNWNSPQALNNWGLALQELSAIVPAREKQTIVRTAISKFRAAIQLQFDFHRAIYNLGTVLYGLAEDTLRFGGSSNVKEVSPDGLYGQSAIYIAAAHALKPNYSTPDASGRLSPLNIENEGVYHSALKLVRSMLPLPYLKVGHLTTPPAGDPVAPHSDWKRSQFVLNHEGMQQLIKDEQKQMSQSLSGKPRDSEKMAIKVDVPDIVSVSACADLTLPPGAGLCINTINGPVFLVADSWESLDGWVDALRLVYTIYARGKADVLAGIITS